MTSAALRSSHHGQAATASNTAQVAALCASLADRKQLCETCKKATQQISAFLLACNADHCANLWPPRARKDGTPYRDEFTDGYRYLPPESVDLDDTKDLPSNVVQHHERAKNLVETAKMCGFCELIRVAIIMDAMRRKGFPYDKPEGPLANILAGIRTGKGGRLFDGIVADLRASEEPIFLMLLDVYGFVSRLDNLRVVWQRSADSVTEMDRRVVWTRLNVFPGKGECCRIKRFARLTWDYRHEPED